MLVVSHTTGGGGVRASDVTHYFPTSQNYYFFCKNGSKRAERVENRVLGGVVVSASDIIEHCPHQIAVFSSSSSWPSYPQGRPYCSSSHLFCGNRYG